MLLCDKLFTAINIYLGSTALTACAKFCISAYWTPYFAAWNLLHITSQEDQKPRQHWRTETYSKRWSQRFTLISRRPPANSANWAVGIKGRFLDLLVNWPVSKPSVNCNSLVKFVLVSDPNLHWLSANWAVNYSCLATMHTTLITSAQCSRASWILMSTSARQPAHAPANRLQTAILSIHEWIL